MKRAMLRVRIPNAEAMCWETRTMAGGDTTIHAEPDAQADDPIHLKVRV
jgi:hypothetical protein